MWKLISDKPCCSLKRPSSTLPCIHPSPSLSVQAEPWTPIEDMLSGQLETQAIHLFPLAGPTIGPLAGREGLIYGPVRRALPRNHPTPPHPHLITKRFQQGDFPANWAFQNIQMRTHTIGRLYTGGWSQVSRVSQSARVNAGRFSGECRCYWCYRFRESPLTLPWMAIFVWCVGAWGLQIASALASDDLRRDFAWASATMLRNDAGTPKAHPTPWKSGVTVTLSGLAIKIRMAAKERKWECALCICVCLSLRGWHFA